MSVSRGWLTSFVFQKNKPNHKQTYPKDPTFEQVYILTKMVL